MIQDSELYIASLVEKINKKRTEGKTFLYELSAEFTTQEKRNEICSAVKLYFNKFGYGVDIHFCQQCGGRTADIIIQWSL